MFDSLIDNLDPAKWEELSSKSEEWCEYQVNRKHKQVDANSIGLMVAEPDGDPFYVLIKFCLDGKDPLKEVCRVELKLNDDKSEVIGLDLNGDIVVRK